MKNHYINIYEFTTKPFFDLIQTYLLINEYFGVAEPSI